MKILHDQTIIGLTEIPGEISLCIPVTNCPFRCFGCHSPEYQEDIGVDVHEHIRPLIESHRDRVTCVVFMGDGDDRAALIDAALLVKGYGLKVALYSGYKDAKFDIYHTFDYVKLGSYDSTLGGLESKTTNQRLIDTSNMADITYKFWREL